MTTPTVWAPIFIVLGLRELANNTVISVEPMSITLNSSNSETSQKKKKRQGSSSGPGLAGSKWAAPEASSGCSAVTSKDPVSTATTIGAMQTGNDTEEDFKSEKAPETKVPTASAVEENREHTTVFTSNTREKLGTVQYPKFYRHS